MPSAVYSYKLPPPVQQRNHDGKTRAHIFVYKAQLMDGHIDAQQLDKNITSDYLWLTRQEFVALMAAEKQEKYANAISRCLLFESVSEQFVSRTLNRLRRRIVNDETVRETVALK